MLAATKPEYALPAAAAAVGADQVANLAKRVSSDQKTIAEFATKTLAEGKRELADAFRRRPGSVLIVIDDIDRLTQEEVRLLFRLIRSNADFPKFTFLLLFDRQVVAAALDAVSSDRGEAYSRRLFRLDLMSPRLNGVIFGKSCELRWLQSFVARHKRNAATTKNDGLSWPPISNPTSIRSAQLVG